MVAASGRVAGVHEASAFKVDEGDLFLAAGAPHGGRKRSRGCSAASGRCCSRRWRSSWRPQAAAWRQKIAAASGCVAARQQTTVAVLAAHAPKAAGGRVAAESCRVKEPDPPDPPLAVIAQSKAF